MHPPRVEDAHTNWYLVENDGAVGIVDASVPHTPWTLLPDALRQLGRTASDLRALFLTHEATRALDRHGSS